MQVIEGRRCADAHRRRCILQQWHEVRNCRGMAHRLECSNTGLAHAGMSVTKESD
jgi:hypothetical protein